MTGAASDARVAAAHRQAQGPPRPARQAGQEPGRPAQARHRARHVAHRLRRALDAHDVRRQADARPRPDAGDRAGEPGVQGQAGRAGRRLHRHRPEPEGGAGPVLGLRRAPRPASTSARPCALLQEKYDVVRAMFRRTGGGFDYRPALAPRHAAARLDLLAGAMEWVLALQAASGGRGRPTRRSKAAHRRYADAVLA